MDEVLWNKAIEIQKDFKYNKISEGRIEAWCCKKPGTSVYSFEIITGTNGIYLNGDIGCLVWNYKNNIKFLTGQDIDYYIYSKLDSRFKGRELCPDKLKSQVHEWLDDEIIDHEQAKEFYECGCLTEAQNLIAEIMGFCDYDISISKPDYNIMFSMYMACYAARVIVGVENGQNIHYQNTG